MITDREFTRRLVRTLVALALAAVILWALYLARQALLVVYLSILLAMAFAPIVRTLLQLQAQGHYRGLVAVEPFDYVPDGPGCAARAIGYLKGLVEAVGATR
ncbi:MAG TPA: hypothetical protein VFZ28_18525 [Burkholderiaceae bacterium]|nr:hypothetical protein [Burkholderiaceae bacterium]